MSASDRRAVQLAPGAGAWSMSECFDHLNISAAQLFIPGIDAAIADARRRDLTSAGPFVYPALQRIFLRLSEPPPKVRFRAPGDLPARATRPADGRASRVHDWQDGLAERIRPGGRPRPATRASPVAGAALDVESRHHLRCRSLAHERRHIWQAREVPRSPGFLSGLTQRRKRKRPLPASGSGLVRPARRGRTPAASCRRLPRLSACLR